MSRRRNDPKRTRPDDGRVRARRPDPLPGPLRGHPVRALYNDYVTLTDAARVGARKAAVSRHEADPAAAAEAQVRGSASGLDPAKLDVAVSAARLGARRDVTVEATYPYEINLLGFVVASGNLECQDHGACGMNRLRSERGQAAVLSVVFLAALLGAVAMVLDVGSWFREQRATQSAADAAALAGAQALPESTGTSSALATQYLAKNGGGAGEFTLLDQERRQRHDHGQGHARAPRRLRQALRDRLGRRARERERALRQPRQRALRRADRGRPAASAAQLHTRGRASTSATTLDLDEDRARRVPAAQPRPVARRHGRQDRSPTGS